MVIFFKKHRLKKLVKQALSDNELTDEECKQISATRESLGISEDYVKSVRLKHFNKQISPVMARVNKSRRFSDRDEQEIVNIAKKLQITPDFAADHPIQIYRALWEIDTRGTFTPKPIDAPIRLTKGEECYHYGRGVWAQVRKVRQHHGYIGASVGFRVAKGVTLRFGKAVPSYSENEGVVDISEGTLYVTSKKLVFVGDKESTSISLGRLVYYERYKDRIEVWKSSGKPDLFRLGRGDLEYIDALLQVLK